ncbi:hypothetical protein QBC39DRAFT_348703 [Podospora conica]|nr:hypothetical protein QBC39DRAFT_348703 [Schizothecium conicum]
MTIGNGPPITVYPDGLTPEKKKGGVCHLTTIPPISFFCRSLLPRSALFAPPPRGQTQSLVSTTLTKHSCSRWFVETNSHFCTSSTARACVPCAVGRRLEFPCKTKTKTTGRGRRRDIDVAEDMDYQTPESDSATKRHRIPSPPREAARWRGAEVHRTAGRTQTAQQHCSVVQHHQTTNDDGLSAQNNPVSVSQPQSRARWLTGSRDA